MKNNNNQSNKNYKVKLTTYCKEVGLEVNVEKFSTFDEAYAKFVSLRKALTQDVSRDEIVCSVGKKLIIDSDPDEQDGGGTKLEIEC